MGQHQPPRGQQHVEPVDPVIQGVKPELRFLLGLLTQLPSQFRDFRRQLDPGFLLWLIQLLVPVQATGFFRSGTRVQADLLTSDENVNSAGALRSTGLPRFVATTAPSDSRLGRIYGYGFPPFVDLEPHPDSRPPSRVSQVPRVDLSTPAVPYHPGEPTRCTCSLLHGRCQVSPYPEG